MINEKKKGSLEKRTNQILIGCIVGVIILAVIFVPMLMRPKKVLIEISYPGHWSGAIGGGTSTKSIEGYGPETWEITFKGTEIRIVTAVIQKMDSGYGQLTVSITTENGRVLAQQSTSAEYGIVTVSWSG